MERNTGVKISIITVNLNNVEGLKKTIDSVISQTYKDFEWIVIDGGSTDGSKELIEQNAEFFSHWVSEKDSGIYNAMNKGVLHAHGDFLQFLNSGDCLADTNVLEDVSAYLVGNSIYYGDYFQYWPTKKRLTLQEVEDDMSFSFLLRHSLCHQSTFTPRQLLEENPFNEEYKIVSDYEFLIKMALNLQDFVHINRVVCVYDMNGKSAIQSDVMIAERRDVNMKLVPKCIYYDCAWGRTGVLIEIRKHYSFFSKFITMSTLFMEKIIDPLMSRFRLRY